MQACELSANMAQILLTLRAASPTSTIVVLQLYNPFAVLSSASTQVVGALNSALASAAAVAGARLANAYVPFNTWKPQPQVLCALTNMCGSQPDIHPTHAGYTVIAQLFVTAYLSSGVGR